MPLIITLLCAMILFTGAVRIAAAGDDVPSPRYVREIDMDQSPLSRSLETLTRLFTANNREARSFLKNVRRIRMGVYDTRDMDDEERSVQRLLESLENDGWITALKVRERDERVWLMFRGADYAVRDVYLVAINPRTLIEVRENRPLDRMVVDVFDRSSRDNRRNRNYRRWDDEDSNWKQTPKRYYRSWENATAALSDTRPDGYDAVHVRYNRVDGAYTGLRLQGNYHARFGLARYGEIGYAYSSRKWQYHAGGEIFRIFGRTHMVSGGFEIHDRTDTQDAWIVGEIENSLSAALFREDYRDYYRRKGMSGFAAYDIGRHIKIGGRYSSDEFGSLTNTVDWRLFDHRYVQGSFRPNPAIDKGRINSARAELTLDTRNRHSNARQGWHISAMFERAGGPFGGDYAFDRYLLDGRRYQPLGRNMRLDVRVRAGASDKSLPVQYLYDLGGISTLRGYGYKAFTGDRLMLVNAECWLDDDLWGNQWPMSMASVGAFYDAGAVWFSQTPSGVAPGLAGVELKPVLRSAAGVAVKISDLRVYVARPLNTGHKDWLVSFRINRSF